MTTAQTPLQITNDDLDKNQYSMYVLKNNLSNLDLKKIVETQYLSLKFCRHYVLNSIRAFDKDFIVQHQPHITKDELITDGDLMRNQYSIELLEKNQAYLDLKTMLMTQKLTADFCKKYILDEELMTVEESYLIDITHVLKYQPHLKYEELE